MKSIFPKALAAASGALLLSAAPAAELADPAGLEAWLGAEIGSRGIPGAVALVVDENDILYVSAHGRRDVAGETPMTEDTIFRIASMTKPIAAAAIMMLVEDGSLSLDDEIADYLPDYTDPEVIEAFDRTSGRFSTRPANRPITIRQLLSHSSGLAYPFASDTISALNAAGITGTDQPLLYEPGEGWSYATGIATVATVLEEIEGMGLDEFLDQRLFRPLAMNDTFYVVPDDRRDRVTTTHRRDDDGDFVEAPNPAELSSAVSGDGGLFSTARDYAKFVQLILNDGVTDDGTRLLASSSIAALGRNQLGNVRVTLQDEPTPALARAFPLGAGRDGFGLGFQITGPHDETGIRAPGSMSWAGIWNTEFWIDPENGIGAVLLMQYLPFYDADAIDVLQGFEAAVYSRLR